MKLEQIIKFDGFDNLEVNRKDILQALECAKIRDKEINSKKSKYDKTNVFIKICDIYLDYKLIGMLFPTIDNGEDNYSVMLKNNKAPIYIDNECGTICILPVNVVDASNLAYNKDFNNISVISV